MSMMRRGPLDRYPVEWVIRQANAHQASGSLEFHTDRPATFFLQYGRVYAAVPGVGDDADADTEAAALFDEPSARQQAVAVLVSTLGSTGGWYYHDPLGHHPARGAWGWEAASLLMETRVQAHEEQSLVAWTDREVAVQEVAAANIVLSADAWAVVVALAGTARAADLRARLGWQPDRLLAALTEMEQHGAVAPSPTSLPSRRSSVR